MIYIDKLHTYYKDPYWITHQGPKQYNQVRGGKGYEYYQSLGYKSVEARIPYGNGDPAYMMHSSECYKKSAETRARLYGSPNACCNTPEVRAKANQTNRNNHNGHLAWNTPEQVIFMMHTQRKNHGGKLAFNTDESNKHRAASIRRLDVQNRIKLTNLRNHEGKLAWHTDEARLHARITNLSNTDTNDPCYFFRTPEAINNRIWSRWNNGFIKTLVRIHDAGFKYVDNDLYAKYKHSHAPVLWRINEFLEGCSEDVRNMLTTFDYVRLTDH